MLPEDIKYHFKPEKYAHSLERVHIEWGLFLINTTLISKTYSPYAIVPKTHGERICYITFFGQNTWN